MRNLAVVLAVIALVAASTVPAAAQNYQTTIQIRYWGAGYGFGFGAVTATDAASTWGGTLRVDHKNQPWSFSARYDSMSVTPLNWGWNGATFWDANVHYRFGIGGSQNLNTYAGLFVGYGGISVNSAGAASSGSGSGFRIGAEFMNRMTSGLYVTGDVAYGPSWSTSFTGFAGMANGTTWDYRAAIGYEFQGGWGLEAGWRYVTWTVPSTAGCPGGCNWLFSGVTAALTFRR